MANDQAEAVSKLLRVEVVDGGQGRRWVVVVPDVRDDLEWTMETARQRLAAVVEPDDRVSVWLDPALYRPEDAADFCRTLWDLAPPLLRCLDAVVAPWPAEAGGPGVDALGVVGGLGALEVWSKGHGADGRNGRGRVRPHDHQVLTLQRLGVGPPPAEVGRAVFELAAKVEADPATIVVVADLVVGFARTLARAATGMVHRRRRGKSAALVAFAACPVHAGRVLATAGHHLESPPPATTAGGFFALWVGDHGGRWVEITAKTGLPQMKQPRL
jgi:hypothetical protein